MKAPSVCKVMFCEKPVFGQQLCNMHYMRQRRWGDVNVALRRRAHGEQALVPSCHPERPYYAKSLCRSCYVSAIDKTERAWRKKNPDKWRAIARRNGAKMKARDPERAYRADRKSNLRKYGITPEQFDALWELQDGKCANQRCDYRGVKGTRNHGKDGLVVDHDHIAGRVRGLLCGSCNRAVGHARENAGRLLGLITYLEAHQVPVRSN